MAGALTAVLFHYSVGSNYGSFNSLIILTLVVITVVGDPWYGVAAAVGYTVVPGYVTVTNITTYLEILFGVSAVALAVQSNKAPTVPLPVRKLIDRLGGRPPESEMTATVLEAALAGTERSEEEAARQDLVLAARAAGPEAEGVRRAPPGEGGLEVRDLSVHYGGVAAVQHVSLAAPTGRITGLVGPNGAGKTTTFNACSGLVKPTGGRVVLHGRDVTGLGPAGRSRLGLGRTFQRAELFNSLTGRKDRQTVRRAVDEAIGLTGIGPLSALQAGLLPAGQRRMVELARVLAGPFDLLLLDEPSAGLDANETQRFGNVLTGAVAERGIGILLVEHDMELVRQVCDHIYVLDFGRLIFEGTPAEMLASPVVRAAYLGSEGQATTPVAGEAVPGSI
jgi:ABC-type branched-subunit amino acid transport system ATPase component